MPALRFFVMIIFIFLCLCVCVPLGISFFTRKFNNPFRLVIYIGKKGSGKSSALLRDMIYYHKKGYVVYTNILDCSLPYARFIDPLLLGDFTPEKNSFLALDEVGMIWDNRNFKLFKASTRDWFKLQRHYKCVVHLASQTWDIDKKLRDLTDEIYIFQTYCNVFSVGRKVLRKLVLTEAQGDQPSSITDNLVFGSLLSWKYNYLPKYAKCFNSFVAPELPAIPFSFVGSALPEDFGEGV